MCLQVAGALDTHAISWLTTDAGACDARICPASGGTRPVCVAAHPRISRSVDARDTPGLRSVGRLLQEVEAWE